MMKSLDEFRFQGRQVPEQIQHGITNYVLNHTDPGGCLSVILENNLREACAQADDDVLWALPVIVAYLYNEVPGACWGSPGKVEAWLDSTDEPFGGPAIDANEDARR